MMQEDTQKEKQLGRYPAKNTARKKQTEKIHDVRRKTVSSESP